MGINFVARKYTEGKRTSPFYFPVQSAFVMDVSRARQRAATLVRVICLRMRVMMRKHVCTHRRTGTLME